MFVVSGINISIIELLHVLYFRRYTMIVGCFMQLVVPWGRFGDGCLQAWTDIDWEAGVDE